MLEMADTLKTMSKHKECFEQKVNNCKASVEFLGSELLHLKEDTIKLMDFLNGLHKTGESIGKEYNRFSSDILGMNVSAQKLFSYATNVQAEIERHRQEPPVGLPKGQWQRSLSAKVDRYSC